VLYVFDRFRTSNRKRFLHWDGEEILIAPQQWKSLVAVVELSLQYPDAQIPFGVLKERIWHKQNIEDNALHRQISDINKKLSKIGGRTKYFVGDRVTRTYRVIPKVIPEWETSTAGVTDTDSLNLKPTQEVEEFLRNNDWQLFAIDEYIQLETARCHPPGLPKSRVHFKVEGTYEPPHDLADFMYDHKPSGGSNKLYGLSYLRHHHPFDDDQSSSLEIGACVGSYDHLFALNLLADPHAGKMEGAADPGRRISFRAKYGNRSIPIEQSPILHNLCAQVVLVTNDGIIVTFRHQDVAFASQSWSASIEETMLFEHRVTKERDEHPFDAAVRGLREELGITVSDDLVRLMSVGLEFGHYTGTFLFIAFYEQPLEAVIEAWKRRRSTEEVVAIDCIPFEKIQEALSSEEWGPTARVTSRPDVILLKPADLRAPWHYTSRPRLYYALKYLEESRVA